MAGAMVKGWGGAGLEYFLPFTGSDFGPMSGGSLHMTQSPLIVRTSSQIGFGSMQLASL